MIQKIQNIGLKLDKISSICLMQNAQKFIEILPNNLFYLVSVSHTIHILFKTYVYFVTISEKKLSSMKILHLISVKLSHSVNSKLIKFFM